MALWTVAREETTYFCGCHLEVVAEQTHASDELVHLHHEQRVIHRRWKLDMTKVPRTGEVSKPASGASAGLIRLSRIGPAYSRQMQTHMSDF